MDKTGLDNELPVLVNPKETPGRSRVSGCRGFLVKNGLFLWGIIAGAVAVRVTFLFIDPNSTGLEFISFGLISGLIAGVISGLIASDRILRGALAGFLSAVLLSILMNGSLIIGLDVLAIIFFLLFGLAGLIGGVGGSILRQSIRDITSPVKQVQEK